MTEVPGQHSDYEESWYSTMMINQAKQITYTDCWSTVYNYACTCYLCITETYLIEQVIQAFIQVLKVEQNHCAPCLHADFDLVDVAANLHDMHTICDIKINNDKGTK